MNEKYYTTNNDHDSGYDNFGKALIPPGGTVEGAIMWFGEPEDATFFRDGSRILDELNTLVDKIEALEEENYNLRLDVRNHLTETEREWS